MKPNYSAMTQEDFDSILERKVGEMAACEILAVAGCYEALSEELNNEVLDTWWAEHQPEEGEEGGA